MSKIITDLSMRDIEVDEGGYFDEEIAAHNPDIQLLAAREYPYAAMSTGKQD